MRVFCFNDCPALCLSLALFLLLMFSTSALSGVHFCNQGAATAAIAIAYSERGEWRSEGWWIAEPGSCRIVREDDVEDNLVFYTIFSKDHHSTGPYVFCTSPNAFKVSGASNCRSRGFELANFQRLSAPSGSSDLVIRFPDLGVERKASTKVGVEKLFLSSLAILFTVIGALYFYSRQQKDDPRKFSSDSASPELSTSVLPVAAHRPAAALILYLLTSGPINLKRQDVDVPRVLIEALDISQLEARKLASYASMKESESGDFVRFLKEIKAVVDPEQRGPVLGMLWRAIVAVGRSPETDAQMRMIAKILGVPDKDANIIRRSVSRRHVLVMKRRGPWDR